MRSPLRFSLVAVTLAALALSACGGDDDDDTAAADDEPATESSDDVTLHLGYFPNVTHAPALVGVEGGRFEDALGDGVTLEPQAFNAGPEAVTALLSGSLDASFIGPNPAINAFAQSNGEDIRIVAGTASGGAYLVVQPEISSPENLAGTTIASPQLGNTQDVALRAWLKDQGYETDTTGGGDVSVIPQENGTTLDGFIAGDIDGAWVPEPWATRLVDEGGGKILVDEADLWENGDYVTTHLVVRTDFLDEHPDVVKALIEGLGESIDLINDDPDAAKGYVNDAILAITSNELAPELIDASFANIEFTLDPIASSLVISAQHAEELGLLDPVDLDGIYALDLVNEVRADRGEEAVKDS